MVWIMLIIIALLFIPYFGAFVLAGLLGVLLIIGAFMIHPLLGITLIGLILVGSIG